jgi:hypothetical protein
MPSRGAGTIFVVPGVYMSRPALTFWKISHVWISYALAGSMSVTLSVVP